MEPGAARGAHWPPAVQARGEATAAIIRMGGRRQDQARATPNRQSRQADRQTGIASHHPASMACDRRERYVDEVLLAWGIPAPGFRVFASIGTRLLLVCAPSPTSPSTVHIPSKLSM